MQKRTNPLELKVESKDYTPAPAPSSKESTERKEKTAETTQILSSPPAAVNPPDVPTAATVATATSQVHSAPAVESEKKEPVAESASVPVETSVMPTTPPVPAPTEAPVVAEPVAAAEHVAPVRPNRPAPKRPVAHNAAEDKIRRGEQIADNDVAVAVKFRVTGDRVDRRMVLTRVSRDVCKLAQALYPEQSLGSIIEGALLTRAFLQDRAAFDAMAREIIEKGGKIKC